MQGAHGTHGNQGNSGDHGHRGDLRAIAHRVMQERGLEPDFPASEKKEVDALTRPADGKDGGAPVEDLRQLLWSSIDNDDSMDLDQMEVAERLAPGADGGIKVQVAIADVDALVPKGSEVDKHAAVNTTSVYTPAAIFPMLPEKLSTDLTSLAAGQDRLAVVIEMVVEADGSVSASKIYRAMVHNWAKLAYNGVGPWIEGHGPLPEAAAAVKGMEEQLKLQDEAAQRLRRLRVERGALQLETIEPHAVFADGQITDLKADPPNRAKQLIEDFMIAANGVTATFLDAKNFPSLRRVVRTPKRWPRIVELAEALGERLPADPDSKALEEFLDRRRQADPEKFPDLSLSVVKLLGSGEYVVDPPGAEAPGHFGLAVKNYSHSTAPNRRYPDILTQRLLKAALVRRALSPTAPTSSASSPPTAPSRRTPPRRSSARCRSRPPPSSCSRRSARASTASSPAPRTRGPTCGSSTPLSRGGWCTASRGWTSGTASTSSWHRPTWSAASSTFRVRGPYGQWVPLGSIPQPAFAWTLRSPGAGLPAGARPSRR